MSDVQSEIQGLDIDIASLNVQIDADFLLNGSATPDSDGISGTFEKNINGDGKLSLSWRSSRGGGIAAGQVVKVTHNGIENNYFLEDNYTPSPNGDGTYTWSPTFVDCDSKMKGVIVYKTIRMRHRAVYGNSGGTKEVQILTFPYTGEAGTLVGSSDSEGFSLNKIASEAGFGGGNDGDCIELNESLSEALVSVSFDQTDLITACQRVADALGVQCTIENGKIRIGAHSALAVSEHYDRFYIFGGTRNMGKWAMEGDDTYAAVTMRLTLPESISPNSVVTLSGGSLVDCSSPKDHMTKVLIFDDIYPKMVLTIKSVRERICYLYDEEGKIMYTEDNGVKIPRTYSKFYITLQIGDTEDGEEPPADYKFDVRSVIQGRTLGLVFQDGTLCGREFDLAYYEDGDYTEDGTGRKYADETNSDEDVEGEWETIDGTIQEYHNEWKTYDGEYRICLVADGDTLLPNHTLHPSVGDHVTLTGVVLDGRYETEAKQQLADAALPFVQLYMSNKATEGETKTVASSENEYVVDFLTNETVNVNVGDSVDENGKEVADGEYVVTSITTDIKTGRQTVRYGTFEPKGKMSSMANKLETASLSDSGALVGGDIEDYIRHTAAMSLDQFATLYNIYGHLGMKTVDKRFSDFTEEFNGMLDDVREQTDQSFLIWFGAYNPANNAFPSSEWNTEELRALHLQDVFYNKDREPGLTGGRMWRWVRDVDAELTIDGTNVVYTAGDDETHGTVTSGGNVYDVVTGGELVFETVGGQEVATKFIIYTYSWEEITDADTLASLEKLADVSNDAILSGGSEKSRVRTEWLHCAAEYARYKEQAEDYLLKPIDDDSSSEESESESEEESSEQEDTITPHPSWLAYENAFVSLTMLLNGGQNADSIIASIGTQSIVYPSWINNANLATNTQMDASTGAETYRATWKAYYDALEGIVTVINIRAKEIADDAAEAASEALARLDDMASDNILDPSEKTSVKREFTAIFHEIMDSTGILDKASTIDDGYVQYIIDETLYITPLVNAFNALGSYLNEDAPTAQDKWAIPTVSLSSGAWPVFALVDVIPTGQDAVSGTTYKVYPKWINAQKGTKTGIDADKWHKLWSDLYTARSNAYTAMSDNALNRAKDALQKLDDMADDDVLTASEKLQVIREWERVVAENDVLIEKATAIALSNANGSTLNTYYACSYALYDILNDLSGTNTTTVGTAKLNTFSDPTGLYNENDTGGSYFDNSKFHNAWADYYAAAESLRAALDNISTKFYVTADSASDTPTLPTPPYEQGNIWLRRLYDGGYKTYSCSTARAVGGTASINDWDEMSIPKDENTMRGTMAALADLVYKFINPSSAGLIATVTLGSNPSVKNASNTDITSSLEVSGTLSLLTAYLGSRTFGIYYNSDSSSRLYDLCCTPITTPIPNSSDTIVGGITIKMYNGTGWEYIQQSTSSLLNNLGTAINAVVFGSNDAAVEAAGMTVGQKYAQMFAQATLYDSNGNQQNLASALFGLNVDYERYQGNIKYYDSNGNWSTTKDSQYTTPRYVSTAKMSADKIDFAGKEIGLAATDTLSFSGGVITFTGGTVNLTAATLNVNADQINWKPDQQTGYSGEIIKGKVIDDQGQQTQVDEVKFEVSDNGDITMRNAYVHGTIYANAGKIGGTDGWTISEKVLTCGNQGQSGYMFLTTGDQQNSATVNGHSANDWRFIVGNKFGVDAGGVMYANSAVLTGAFTTAGGKIQLAETDYSQSKGYKWYGMAYVNNFDALAIGMRDYGSSFGGHLAMQGGGSVGGIFDILVGGDKTQSVIRMGGGTTKMGIEIDGYGSADKSGRIIRIGDYAMSNDGTLTGTDYVKMYTTTVGGTTTGHIDATGSLTVGTNASNQRRAVISDTEVAFPAIFMSVARDQTVDLPSVPKQGQLVIVKGYGGSARLNPGGYEVMDGSDNASALSNGYFYVEDQTVLLCFDYNTGNGTWHQVYSA